MTEVEMRKTNNLENKLKLQKVFKGKIKQFHHLDTTNTVCGLMYLFVFKT